MKTVSILVPVYGVELYIEQCARSLFEQSYPHCEFIFVGDGSPDRSIELLRGVVGEYQALAPQIVIIEKERNGGVAAARNTALDAASGHFVLFVDADDWVAPTLVEETVARATVTRAQICNAWCRDVDARGEGRVTPARWLNDKRAHLRAIIGQSHIVANHLRGMLFERSLFELHNLRFTPQVDFGEDYSLLPQLIYYASGLSTLERALYFYRVENLGSYMNNIGEKQIRNYVAAQRIVSRFVASLPDAADYEHSLEVGRLNIKKWIFKRGVVARTFDEELFGCERPEIKSPLLRLYNRVIDCGNPLLIKLFSVVVNLPLYLRTR